ncbi:hypothetical protein [Streptomyces tuirus]|uniref:hypothetical protein n=1 Tax=Streptomyces tuirus TaxID=68278 RepID=UPI0034122C19
MAAVDGNKPSPGSSEPPSHQGEPSGQDPNNKWHLGNKLALVSAVLAVLGIVVPLIVTNGDDEDKDDGQGVTAPKASASTRASAPSSPEPSASAVAESPEPSTDPAKPFPGEPLPLRLNGDSTCDFASHIDLDSYPFVTRVDRAEPDAEDAAAPADLNWYGCSPVEFGTARDSHAGVLSKRQPFGKEACEAAANGGGLEEILMHSNEVAEAGIIAGNSICVITDKGRLVRAQIVEAPWAPNLSLKITTVS